MKHTAGHQLHMWLIGAAVVASLLLGASYGWALALALVGCGTMLAVVFWIGRSSVQQMSVKPVDQDHDTVPR